MGAAENNNLIVVTATMHNPIKQDLVKVSWAIVQQHNHQLKLGLAVGLVQRGDASSLSDRALL